MLFPAEGGGFQVRFTGPMMLHGEYGGEEGKLAFTNEILVYGDHYVFEVCKQQGLFFRLESLAPIRTVPVDGYFVTAFRVTNRMLGEGIAWGAGRTFPVDATTLRLELREVFTFL